MNNGDATIYRKSEMTDEELEQFLAQGFVEVQDDLDEENLVLNPTHWHVCVSGEKYTFMFDNTYLLPLTTEAEDFCDYEDDGVVP